MNRRLIVLVLSFALVTLVMSLGGAALIADAATIAPTTTCANGVDNPGGKGLICEVTVVNAITASGGSATVTVRECHGSAGDPAAACMIKTVHLTKPVSAINQCNGSANGGGASLTCTATGTKSAAFALKINQCNGSANGGGALAICSAAVANKVVAPTPTPSPIPTPTPSPIPSVSSTPNATPTMAPTSGASSTPKPRSTASLSPTNADPENGANSGANIAIILAGLVLLGVAGGLILIVKRRSNTR